MEELDSIPKLIAKHLKGQLDESGQRELQAWINKNEANKRFFEQATDETVLLAGLQEFTQAVPDDTAFQRTLAEHIPGAKLVGMRPWRKYIAVAASVLVVVATGAYLINKGRSDNEPALAKNIAQHTSDVPPGHNGAVLTLADGRKLVLDSAAAGALATQGNAKLLLTNGKLSYAPQAKAVASTEIYYNQLTTPRGRKFRITLPDSSNVWLNAESSLRYPAQFTGRERRVDITGEAYFEIAHNAAKPFIVHTSVPTPNGPREADITVLGTHFNVMAYQNEEATKTTLLEGRISIKPLANQQKPTIINPGQQAAVTLSSARPEPAEGSKGARAGVTVSDDIDVDQVIAWKNDLLSFQHSDIKTLMRSVERWYDINVVYEGNLPERTFSGKFSSNANLSQLLTILDLNSIHYTINGRLLTIKP